MSTHVCGISGTYRIWVMPGRWPLVLPVRSCLSLGPRATHMPQSVLLLMVLIVVKVIWFPLEMNRTDKWPHSLLRWPLILLCVWHHVGPAFDVSLCKVLNLPRNIAREEEKKITFTFSKCFYPKALVNYQFHQDQSPLELHRVKFLTQGHNGGGLAKSILNHYATKASRIEVHKGVSQTTKYYVWGYRLSTGKTYRQSLTARFA